MYKIMCLDVGTKRIGVALSDFLHVIATPHSCIDRQPENKAIEAILKIAKEVEIYDLEFIDSMYKALERFVLTKGESYSDWIDGEDCIKFSQKISGFDIILEDERLTSEEAEERLRLRKVDFKKNKGLVDMESACVILEQYIGRK